MNDSFLMTICDNLSDVFRTWMASKKPKSWPDPEQLFAKMINPTSQRLLTDRCCKWIKLTVLEKYLMNYIQDGFRVAQDQWSLLLILGTYQIALIWNHYFN